MKRREFLRKSVLAGAGCAVAVSVPWPAGEVDSFYQEFEIDDCIDVSAMVAKTIRSRQAQILQCIDNNNALLNMLKNR